MSIKNFRRTTAASVSQPVDLNLAATLSDRTGDLRAVMRTRGTVIGRLQASLTPLARGAGGWAARLGGAPVRGGIRYIGPADTLFSFAGLNGQRLSGPLGVGADFSCTVSSPCLNGVVRGKGLTYVNQAYGTRLTDMALSGRFSGNRLEIQQLTARAGNGSVTGNGYVSLAAAQGYPARIDLKLDDARLADSDAIAATASGEVRLIKAAGQAPTLIGTVTLPETRYQIIRQGSAKVPELTGVRFKPPRGPARITGDATPATSPGFGDVKLDLDVRAPGRGTSLAAAKYLTNNIYVEVVTDVKGFTATQIEVALSRSLSILSQAGGQGGTDVSIRYRKTY